jgi:hypothetical protein
MDVLVAGLCLLSVDVLLLCRVIAVVPPSRTSWRVFATVYTFPILNKVVRLALLIMSSVQYTQDARLRPTGGETFDTTRIRTELIQWSLTAADNA